MTLIDDRPDTRVHDITTARYEALTVEAHRILDEAIARTKDDNRRVAGIVILLSGGKDSTTVADLFKGRATHIAHANTGIGIEQTREFVRDTAASWGLPLIEKHPDPHATYRELVLGNVRAMTGKNKGTLLWPGGFPGPAAHWMMYQRLKERALEKVRNEIVSNPYRERVIFIAGRRAEESERRKILGVKDPVERRGSIVWASPVVSWTKLDLNEYRRRNPQLPVNEVSDLLHMSGECLCGAFAHPGELDEVGDWFPEVAAYIHELEHEVQAKWDRGELPDIPRERCTWGWGAGKEKASKTGPLCDNCASRFIPATE